MLTLPQSLADEATAQWQTFQEAMAKDGRALPLDPTTLDALLRSFAFSRFVAQTCISRPMLAADLLESGDLMRPCQGDDLAARLERHLLLSPATDQPADQRTDQGHPDPAEFQKQLRLFRHREMVRIAVRDLAALTDLDTTLADLTDLADTCVQHALDYLFQRQCAQWGTPIDDQGQPQKLVVLGMGKLGAHELNFSSDVDLIFAYPREGTTHNGVQSTSNEDFFLRLGRSLIQMIGAQTAEGFVFRVDMRLRPFGDSGPLVLSFDRMEAYYQYQGREWERYALIKARAIAGDIPAGRQLLQRLSPFVFRRYLDYNAFESLRDMKQRIATEVQNKGLQDNIKLGPGGIREVEFFGQIFQLLRGGVEPELQIRPIQKVLQHLVAQHYITAQIGQDLSQAYIFLRRVENRIQAYSDQQQHSLPQQTLNRLRLACAMGFAQWDPFALKLQQHRHLVHHHFNELLGRSDARDKDASGEKTDLLALSAVWQEALEPAQADAILTKTGFGDPANVLVLLNDLRHASALKSMSANGRNRLAKLIPLMLQAVGKAGDPQLVLLRLFDLVLSICRRTAYLSLLCEYPTILTHLVRLFEASPWIAALLNHHPVLLDELLDPRTLYRPPGRDELAQELRSLLKGIPKEDFEHQIESMRIFKQTNVLRVAASDITHVLPLMKVSDHLSDLAEVILNEVVESSWQHLVAKHGTPTCRIGDKTFRQGFAVIAYGKLGGLELGYRSDLDLVFLHAASPGQTQGGARPIDNAIFFARLGQRVLHILTAHTSAGILYDTDMRLRPSGDSGMLVSHIQGFRDYQLNDAWTWEHQALLRSRAIIGDPEVKKRFEQVRTEVLTQSRDRVRLRDEVAQMRQKLRQAEPQQPAQSFNIKQGPGGIVDIEFIVQYLILAHAHRYPDMVRWTDNVRLLQELSHHQLIDTRTAFGLRQTYLILRAMAHRLNLKEAPAHIDDQRLKRHRALVRQTWKKHLKD
jgi:[glutamine synthetase] adenylyltransferase / [glutamine synthetase]-adenylyl-L-tyrosine phosphorylase